MQILLVLLILFPSVAAAASVSLVESDAGVSVYVDAEREPINLVEGTIEFTWADVGRVEIGDSIIPLWIEVPSVADGQIRFAGMIPGGFHGTAQPARGLDGAGLLFFVPGARGPAEAAVSVYLHDGTGTRRAARIVTSTGTRASEDDTVPPEAVEVGILPGTSETPRLLVAIGNDVGSGVARYEISFGDEWQEFTPPMEIARDETRRIVVRIFDHAGNFREIVVQEAETDKTRGSVTITILLMLVICGFVIAILRGRRSSRAT